MAELQNTMVEETHGGESRDLCSILSSFGANFLIRNNGEQVEVENLKGKKVGLYFSESSWEAWLPFTPKLVEVYNELLPKGDFEVVFVLVDYDDDEESWSQYFSEMPWLAIPFSNEARGHLYKLFTYTWEVPNLVILDETGKVLTDYGEKMIREYGAEAYPFTAERIMEIKKLARREQSLKSILVSHSRDYLIAADGKKVPVTELEGKIVSLYFSSTSASYGCIPFTKKLVKVYQKLKERGEDFEIVHVPVLDKKESFELALKSMPWFSLPIEESILKLVWYFELDTLPSLVIIGPDGKTLHSNVVEAIEEHGVQAYPFTPQKFAELLEIEKAKREQQTLVSILVLGDKDFVIRKDGIKIPVHDLVGKNILLYFSAQWCAACGAFLPKLIEAYHKIKAKEDAFEVIFISFDNDQNSFDEFISQMPWLAVPFGDERNDYLTRIFNIQGLPTAVAIGPNGKTVTTEARNILMYHGADAYPFTDDRIKMMEAEQAEADHELHLKLDPVLTRRQFYTCDDEGHLWSFDGEVLDNNLDMDD